MLLLGWCVDCNAEYLVKYWSPLKTTFQMLKHKVSKTYGTAWRSVSGHVMADLHICEEHNHTCHVLKK